MSLAALFRHLAAPALVLGLALSLPQAHPATAEDLPSLRIATQVSGTVNWELTTIAANGLDRANGFAMAISDVAAGPAAQIAFQAGEADVIVSDWLWVARLRAEGQDILFLPYSRAVGALMVPADSPARRLSDLKGRRIGVAGGPLDKSWLILRAAAQAEGFDLQGETEQVFGAPPLIHESLLSGALDGAVNVWHFNAKASAAGLRPLASVADAAQTLGLSAEMPLLGYVIRGDLLRDRPDVVQGLARASRAAKTILSQDDAAWQALRPLMKADSDAQFEALKAGFRAGIPAEGPVDVANAERMFAIMAGLGGAELVGPATSLPPGVFLQPTPVP